MLGDLTYIVVVVLVPLIPAFLLYRFLPEGATDVNGPFKGLTIKLSGSFAGYFLVLLTATSLLVFLIKTKPSPPPCPACPPPPANRYDVYTVTGKVDLDRSGLNSSQVTLSLLPPLVNWGDEGDFSFDIPVRPGQSGDLNFPKLQLKSDVSGGGKQTIDLQATTGDGFRIVRNDGAKTISIVPSIVLARRPSNVETQQPRSLGSSTNPPEQ